MPRRVLHVAALPFPSPQGTQALLHHMLLAHQEAGWEAHLLCYAHGDGRAVPYGVHRVDDWPRLRSMRSGPSWLKPVLDVRLAQAVRELRAELRPDLVVAHHVEAAACVSLVMGKAPWVFYAHTDLGAELPTYLSAPLSRAAKEAGRGLDAYLTRRAPHTCAVSRPLAERLARRGRRAISAPDLPWSVAPPTTREGRQRARRMLGLSRDREVVLYAGNLDRYQGLDTWLDALRQLSQRRPRLTWLLATASDTSELRARMREDGLEGVMVVCQLNDESREQVHAAADIAVVPRRTPGGVPVKLLDALGRGLPVVAVRRAAAGLPLEELAWLVEDGAQELARGVEEALDRASERVWRRKLGRAYVATRHSPTAWASQLAHVVGELDLGSAAPFSVSSRSRW